MPDASVSVVIPVYNGADFLRESVESVTAQTYEELQVVIVNDGSTDRTQEVAEELRAADPRIHIVEQENRGLSGARNSGIAAATGEFINFLDADDWLFPDKIRRQVDALIAEPEYGLVYSDYVIRSEGTETPLNLGPMPLPERDLLMYRSWFAPMVPLLRRSLVEKVGEFDTRMRTTEDRDYWYRCALETRFLYLPGPVAAYRVHPHQMSKNRSGMKAGHRQFASKHFENDRRRYRSCWSLHHLAEARFHKSEGEFGRAIRHLAGYVTSVNSLEELALVWRISR